MNKDTKGFVFSLILTIIISVGTLGLSIYVDNNKKAELYNLMSQDIEKRDWESAKNKLDELGEYKNSEELAKIIRHNYYYMLGDESFKNKQYRDALNNYQKSNSFDSSNKILLQKINETEKIIQKLKNESEKAKKLKQQQEELKIQRMLNNVVILSQHFGYTQYGEYGVVGKIKNNNSFPVQVRADIDLKDYNGNVIDATYTYDRIAPYSIWDFEAPIFGNITPHHSYMHLTIERLD